jgi:hypothetical protein
VLSLGFAFTGCSNDDDNDVDRNTVAEVFQIRGSFDFDRDLGWFIQGVLDPRIRESDNLLIYRLSGINETGKDVWQQIPRTYYLNADMDGDGYIDELDYYFDFSVEDFMIYAGGTYDLKYTPDLIRNQTFRIVIIPGEFYATRQKDSVDYSDYEAVIKYYNIDDSKIKVIERKSVIENKGVNSGNRKKAKRLNNQ